MASGNSSRADPSPSPGERFDYRKQRWLRLGMMSRTREALKQRRRSWRQISHNTAKRCSIGSRPCWARTAQALLALVFSVSPCLRASVVGVQLRLNSRFGLGHTSSDRVSRQRAGKAGTHVLLANETGSPGGTRQIRLARATLRKPGLRMGLPARVQKLGPQRIRRSAPAHC